QTFTLGVVGCGDRETTGDAFCPACGAFPQKPGGAFAACLRGLTGSGMFRGAVVAVFLPSQLLHVTPGTFGSDDVTSVAGFAEDSSSDTRRSAIFGQSLKELENQA